MATVKIVSLHGGETWSTWGTIVELTEEDFNKLSEGEVDLVELCQRKAYVSEKDFFPGKEIV